MSSVAAEKSIRSEPFGARAIMMGFATTDQIESALNRQRELAANGEKKLLGMILVDMQVLNTTQLLAILKTYEK